MSDYLYLVWKGARNDDGIWFSRLIEGLPLEVMRWTDQTPVGNVGTITAPKIVSFRGRLVMAWRGIDGDQGIWFSVFDGSNWTPQQQIRGVGSLFGPALA